MVREAEENRDADEKRKEEVELKNKAEQYLNSIDTALQEKGASLDPKQKEETEKLRVN
jgi:molecular chaperone DnaK